MQIIAQTEYVHAFIKKAGHAMRRSRKTFLIMRLTAVLLLLGTLTSYAKGKAQVVTINEANVSLQKVIKAIQQQTGFGFNYNAEILKGLPLVTVSVSRGSLKEVLDECFQGLPISYFIGDKYVVLSKKNMGKAEMGYELVPDSVIAIVGFILDSIGNPLNGATITVKGSGVATTSSMNGKFEIKQGRLGDVLVVSFVGYETKEILITNNKVTSVYLSTSDSRLDEVQVIAYGTTTKRLSTGNIGTVKSADVERQPIQNPLLALQGRVPGVTVIQNTGISGGGVTVRVQGQNSINEANGNDPLYVIDGVPYASQMISTTRGGMNSTSILGSSGGASSSGRGNPLSYINPSDIASIDVLKDADATAIYGSRAANGAILITTKKGKSGDAKLDLNLQHGWSRVARKIDMLNTQEYLMMRKEAFKNDNVPLPSIAVSPTNTNFDINGLWDTTAYTDWQKELIGGTAKTQNVTMNVTGGNNRINYLLGSTFNKETTVFPGDFYNTKTSVHFSVSTTSANDKFSMQLTGSYMADRNNLPATDFTASAIGLAPNAPRLYNEDGTVNWMPNSSGTASWTNPIAQIYNVYKIDNDNLLSNAVLGYKILPWLETKASIGYSSLQTTEFQANPFIAISPDRRPNSNRTGNYTDSRIASWIFEPQLSLKKSLFKGDLSVLIGTTFQRRNSNGKWLRGTGYSSDQLIGDILSASQVTPLASEFSVYKYNALFARINYNLSNTYVLNLTGRRDGSSRFGNRSRFHDFGAVGAAWIFSQYAFIKRIKFLSFGKLRASYGTTGNDQIPDYSFMNLYTSNSVGVPYQGVSGVIVNGLPNPYLEWEETKKTQVGVEFGFLRDRILLIANYADNRSSNQLLNFSLNSTTGFSAILGNFPATVQNKSFEFSISSTNIQSKKVKWNTNFNLTIPRNRLKRVDDLSAISFYGTMLVVGEPLDIQKRYEYHGVDTKTGVYQFLDSKGVSTFTPTANDRNVLMTKLPKFYGGFQNSIDFGKVQLDFLFQFVSQLSNGNFLFRNSPGTFASGLNNQPKNVLNRWQKDGDVASVQKFSQASSLPNSVILFGGSNAINTDASYLRLKNVSLSYVFPAISRLQWLKGLKIYSHAQNLLTITRFKGLDPENQTNFYLPPLRIITVGISASF